MTTKSDPQNVLILESDRLRAATMFGALGGMFPGATVRTATEPKYAAEQLMEATVQLFVVALRGFDLDVITLLTVLAEHRPKTTSVLVVTNEVNISSLRALLHVPIGGVFDCFDGDIRELEFACRVVASGGSYWSRTVREVLQRISSRDYPSINRWSERIAPSAGQSRFKWSDVPDQGSASR